SLVVLWPDDVSKHIRSDGSSYAVEGLTIPTGTVTEVSEHSCDGQVGSVPGVDSLCATAQVRVDEGPEEGQIVEVIFTAAQYASGVTPGTKVKMFRTPLPDGTGIYQFSDFE